MDCNQLLAIAMGVFPNNAGGGSNGQQSPLFMIGWIVIMIAIFYLIMIRPQQKKEKERKVLLSGVKTGDKVIFGGGIFGTVTNVKEKTLIVKVADNVKMEVLRSAVAQVLEKGQEVEETK